MAPPADPYRTLGLGRDASLDQVKRAYRRLAKANHPDTAGEAAVPRFLAIKAAYEAIAGPEATDLTRGRRPATPRRPWEADPSRAEATRRAYGARARGPRPASGSRPASGPRPAAGPPPDADTPPPGADGPERPPNLATLGSTTYDGTEGQPFEPDWGGASWYGTTSGTYWTLNPKEYADPRKHGPEYQARARRARRTAPDALDPADEPAPAEMPADAPGPDETVAEAARTAGPAREPDAAGPAVAEPVTDPSRSSDPTHTTASWWDATAGAAAEPAIVDDAPSPAASDDLRARFLDDGRHGLLGRIGFAVVGWAPIAAAIGALATELTGCARSGATCTAADAPIAGFAQIAILAVLLVVPLLGRLAAMAAVAVLVVAIPGALLVAALAGPTSPDTIPLGLTIAMGAAWLVGLALSGLRESRRPVRPVS